MVLAIFLSFLQVFTAADSSNLVSQSKSQAEFYINQLEDSVNVEENIWALTVLGSEKAEIKKFIEGKNSPSLFNKVAESSLEQLEKASLQTGSPNLLIAALLATEKTETRKSVFERFSSKFELPTSKEIDYQRLCEAIVNKREINREILPSEKFFLPHFFILFNPNYSTFFPSNYLQDITEKWSFNSSAQKDLNSILEDVSYFRVLYLMNKYSETDPFYASFTSKNIFPNSSFKLSIYQYLDYSMYRLGYFDRSLKIVRNFAIPLAKFSNQEDKELQLTQLQGVYLYSIGKIKPAAEMYQKVLNNIDRTDPQIRLSILYNNLALTYHQLGKYEEYLDLQFQALEDAKRSNNYSHQIEILNNLYIYYRKSGDSEKALSYLKEAQEIAIANDNIDDLGTIYTSLGAFHRTFQNDYKKAHEYFDKAEQVLEGNNPRYYIKLLNEKAEAFEAQQELVQALEIHDKIIGLTNEEKNSNYLDAIVNKALVNLKMNNIEQAGDLIAKYNSDDLDQLNFPEIIKAKTVESDYLQRTDNPQKALELLEPALEQIVEWAKSSADLESGFWHVEDEYLDAFELVVSIYRDLGEEGKAIQTLDQLKTINDASLYQNPLVKSSLLDESELTQYKQLTDQLDAMRKKLLTVSEDRQFEIRQTISQLNVKKRQLDQKLTKEIDSDPTSIREVQNHLSARELMLHITELNDRYYVAKITRSDVSIDTIPLDSSLRNLLSNSVQQIATNETNLDSLYKISQILDLQEIPDRVEQIILIPDSYFYQLPIDILPLNKPKHSYSYGEATYLIEKFRTQYLTSLEDLKSDGASDRLVSQNQLHYTGYGVSNFKSYNNKSLVSLPFAQTEVMNIANRLTHFTNVQTFVNEQSTKATFEKTAPTSQIIHLATHSEVSERDPMFSTVYLSNTGESADSTFDSQIFAYELFELDLSNEMIMLNSCESGSGPYIQGTGVMGMSRALRYAGANSLVLNLWSVNDMLASDFAIHFYDQLNKGKSKAEALQDTKRYFLSSKNASPHFWGPYMLIGNSDPIVQPNQDTNMAVAGSFIFYFLIMISLSYLTQQGFLFRNKKQAA